MATYQWKDIFDRVFQCLHGGYTWDQAFDFVCKETGLPQVRVRLRMFQCQDCRSRAEHEFESAKVNEFFGKRQETDTWRL